MADTNKVIESLERVIHLGESLLTNFDIEQLLVQVVNNIKELLKVEGATLYLVDPVEKLMISQVILSDRMEQIVLKVDSSSIAGFAALNRRTLIIPDAYGDLSAIHPDLRFNKKIDEANKFHTRNLITHPLVVNDELLGVFQAVNKIDGDFNDEDERILRNFSVFVGIGIINARLVMKVLEEQANVRDVIEYIDEKVIILDREGKVEHLNRPAIEELPPGHNLTTAKGKRLIDLNPQYSALMGEVRKLVESNLDKSFSGGKQPYVILTVKNQAQLVEKVILIIKRPAAGPADPVGEAPLNPS
ncbi:MAG TPA: GAF domain-containing protein [Candidatus Ozemobacteraceae bacterium]|nr:GAF domain-containing protein [Candidatus Ozemobacteraceae bacterium]